MGMRMFGSSSTYDSNKNTSRSNNAVNNTIIERIIEKPAKKLPNPDPYNWILNESYETNKYLLVNITYPDCTNYEGKKIMLYEGVTIDQLRAQKTIDPHFSSNKRYYSPIARFEPTNEGWKMGKKLIEMMHG